MFTPEDHAAMREALALAERGLYTTTPNPRVGCVIVRGAQGGAEAGAHNGAQAVQVLGRGFTQPAGQNHAEIEALNDAHRQGHDVRGATAYVTLEPCSHHGRTPPCCDALIRAGLARVVAAMEDPNPLVSGRGLAALKAAGIQVDCGLMADAARELNLGFVARMTRGWPWVRVKIATSLDGRSALNNGHSQWITGSAARADGHAWRARACAILTGSGTALRDDPALTVREVLTPRQPVRMLVDGDLRISPEARLVRAGGLVIFTGNPDADRVQRLVNAGCELVPLPGVDGRVDLSAVLRELGRRQINELHIEAGAGLSGALLRSGLVDEILLYLAPVWLGPGLPSLDLPELESLDQALRWRLEDLARVGEDVRLRLRPRE